MFGEQEEGHVLSKTYSFFRAGPVPKVSNSYPNLLFSVLFFLSLSARKEGEDVEREEGRGGTLIKFLPHREFLRPPAPPSENKYKIADYIFTLIPNFT